MKTLKQEQAEWIKEERKYILKLLSKQDINKLRKLVHLLDINN